MKGRIIKMVNDLNNYIPEYIKIEDYPDVDNIEFPSEIYISVSLCGNDCGACGFIVDGSTQICEYCGRLMIKHDSKKYILAE